MDAYEMKITVEVRKSPLRDGWYARLIVDGATDQGNMLTGMGSTAIAAAQSALNTLSAGATYPQLIIETALLYGTRTKPVAELPRAE